MFGMFAYKAATLVQVYKDNEDLQLIFPENEDGSSDWNVYGISQNEIHSFFWTPTEGSALSLLFYNWDIFRVFCIAARWCLFFLLSVLPFMGGICLISLYRKAFHLPYLPHVHKHIHFFSEPYVSQSNEDPLPKIRVYSGDSCEIVSMSLWGTL